MSGDREAVTTPDQDLINAATVIARIANRHNRHPDTRDVLLPIADDLRRRAFASRAPSTADAGGASLTDAERAALVSRIKWNLDHFGPLRDDGTPYSRFESPAHAAADAVYDWLAARANTAQDEGLDPDDDEAAAGIMADARTHAAECAGEVERLKADAVDEYADAVMAEVGTWNEREYPNRWDNAREKARHARKYAADLRAVVDRTKDREVKPYLTSDERYAQQAEEKNDS